MKKLILILSTFLFMGCQTLRMKYTSEVEVAGQKQDFVYTNSYPVGGAHATLCALTGVFMGGYCWFYLVMPTPLQKEMAIEEAEEYLSSELGKTPYSIENAEVTKIGYSETDSEIVFNKPVLKK